MAHLGPMQSRCSYKRETGGSERDGVVTMEAEDVAMLGHKPGMEEASRSWKAQENRLSPRASRRNSAH